MSTVEFFSTIAAVIIAAATPTVSLGVYLSSRIDKLGERVGSLEVTVAAGFARVDERLDHLEKRFDEHVETHARFAHPR